MECFNNLKKLLAAVFLIFAFICLAACEKKSPGNSGPVVRQDEDGLVEVRIEKGEATVSFDLDKWEKQYKINFYAGYLAPSKKLESGPFPLGSLSGKVVDACVGKVFDLDDTFDPYDSFHKSVMPSIMLLMENGSVEWVLANPLGEMFNAMEDTSFFMVSGLLPFINNIVSISCEKGSEGFGENAFFATAKDGSRYDLAAPCKLLSLYDFVWACRPIGDGFIPTDDGPAFAPTILTFYEEGGVSLKRRRQGGFLSQYSGTYKIDLIKDADRFPASISFDLSLDWWDTLEGDTKNPPQKISGKYSMEVDSESWALWLADGEALFKGDNVEPEGYSLARLFQNYYDLDMTGNTPDYFEESLSILETLCEDTMNDIAKGMMVVNGEEMFYLNNGEVSYSYGKVCHIVHLGNYVNDRHFVTKSIYAVSGFQVYRYDVKTKKWITLVMG